MTKKSKRKLLLFAKRNTLDAIRFLHLRCKIVNILFSQKNILEKIRSLTME
jgi:hypothetical protein